MQTFIGHVLFPTKSSLGCNAVKRFRSENGAHPNKETNDEISIGDIRVALQSSVPDGVVVEEHLHSGRGASFCFVPGVLALSLRTPAHEPLSIPADLDLSMIEASKCIPRFAELRINQMCSLRVYWEERSLVYASSLDKGETSNSGCNGNANDRDDEERALLMKRLLVVGAGGIGCELLKVLVLYGFRNIDIFDLDTIDATNLNRQFLFCMEDVGASKSEVARRTLLEWFANVSQDQRPEIRAHHANIKDPKYDDAFFSQFALVLNALDNVSARQHVNRMCMRNDIPLVESGTMGYNGQVQPIVKGLFECYDCQPKAADKPSVAVCTIHARPTTMVHCVHYAKELYQRLFGDTAIEGNEDLTNKGDELAFVDAIISHQGMSQGNGSDLRNIFVSLARCLFRDKIEELLAMKTAWPTQPPVPLTESLFTEAFLRANDLCTKVENEINRDSVPTVEEALALFLHAVKRCGERGFRVAFLKEDNDTVDFVASTANLRAEVFHIPRQSVEDIRSIAGSIVPAVVTTNAIVAAAVVQQALALLHMQEMTRSKNNQSDHIKSPFGLPQMVYVRKVPQIRRRRQRDGGGGLNNGIDLYLVHSAAPNAPNRTCTVCNNSQPIVRVRLDTSRVTIGVFVRVVLGNHLGMDNPSVFHGANVIYEKEEYEALVDAPLQSLMAGLGSLEFIVDDMDHDVEWRLVVSHQLRELNPNNVETVSEDEVVVVEGIEEAAQLERDIIEERRKNREKEQQSVPNMTVQMAESTQTRVDASAVVCLDSESEDADSNVVEID